MPGFGAGQAALASVMFLFFISLAVAIGFVAIASREVQNARAALNAKRSFALAEAGVEDVVYRLKTAKPVSSAENYALAGVQVSVTVTDNAGAKEVVATGNSANAIRKVKATLRQGTSGVGFVFGVQADAGGIEMDQNSRIQGAGGAAGNVYSNGPITGENGATITGDATSAGALGAVDDVIVFGTVRAHGVTSVKVCGNAHYATIDGSSLTFLNDPSTPTCPTPLTPGTANPGAPDAAPAPFPISSSQIQQWQEDATAGGIINGNCGDGGAAECTIANNGTLSLGPKKITGNLVLTKKQTLIVTGTLFFTGSISMDSSSGATIKCDPAYGASSCMVITASWIHISNNAIFQGSGTSGSYIMVLSTVANCNGGSQTPSCAHNNAGVEFHNNATGAIFYIPYSMAYLKNGVGLTELAAYKAHLENTATITYQQGLANIEFSSGPTGGWTVQEWKEVE